MGSRHGFSLLEATVALAVVGLAGVGLLEAVAAHLRAADRTRAALEADALVRDRIDRLRLLTYDQLAHLPDSARGGNFGPRWPGISWRARSTADRSRRDLFDVTVEVTWPEGRQQLATRLYRVSPSIPRAGIKP